MRWALLACLCVDAALPQELCLPNTTLERHDFSPDHGDLCRSPSGWVCPRGCEKVARGLPPYCRLFGLGEGPPQPCRAPRPAGERPYLCDAGEGERGVCVLAVGPSEGQGEHFNETCDGKCGRKAEPNCRTDWDCSLAGVCVNGACLCDAWATGHDCSYLHFKSVDRGRLGYLDRHSSWGGNAVFGADRRWHLFLAEIACDPATGRMSRCGLNGWQRWSQVAHAIADRPDGPYFRSGLVLPVYAHNPTVLVTEGSMADTSDWHLYYISGETGPIMVTTSVDQGKTWGPGREVAHEQNPGPYLHRNGSMTLLYREDSGHLPSPTCSTESIMVHRCETHDSGCSGGGTPVFKHTAEDPSVFRDERGNFHMLMNVFPYLCVPKSQQGGHAWSRDGVTWSEPRSGAFNSTILFEDGSSMTCLRRERPQMLLDPQTGRPLALVTAVVGCPPFGAIYRGGDDSFTLVQLMQQ